MSTFIENPACADCGMMNKIDLKSDLNDKDVQGIKVVLNTRLEVDGSDIICRDKKPLADHFEKDRREVAVANAIKDGYTQVKIEGIF